MDQVIAREYRPEELEMGLEVRNKIFPPLSPEEWAKGEPQTASIAFIGEETVGFIPLSYREFRIAPGVTITSAFENAVGTKEEHRGKGIGTAMIEAAAEFLKGKADALFVYRGGERSRGYNFYAKTGHIDLHYMRHFIRDNSLARYCEDVTITQGVDNIAKLQEEMNLLFQGTYGAYGGYPLRYPGYWTMAMTRPIYIIRPTDFYLLTLREGGHLIAYLLGGVRQSDKPERFQVLEMATRGYDQRGMERLLEMAAFISEEKNLQGVDVFVGDKNPFIGALDALNFTPSLRGMQIMSRSFDSKALFHKVWEERFNMPGVKLNVWTPQQDFTLLDGGSAPVQTITLEMKEETLTRWLMGRVDFKARVREGTITLVGGNDRVVEDIAKAIPLCDWEYHHLDYV
jgi:GNAT superfamily N-acetyltransferase